MRLAGFISLAALMAAVLWRAEAAPPAGKAVRVDELPALAGIEYADVAVETRYVPRSCRWFSHAAVTAWVRALPADDAATETLLDRVAAAWRTFPAPDLFQIDVSLVLWEYHERGENSSRKLGYRDTPWFAHKTYGAVVSADAVIDSPGVNPFDFKNWFLPPDEARIASGKWIASRALLRDAFRQYKPPPPPPIRER